MAADWAVASSMDSVDVLEAARPGFRKQHEDFVQFLELTLKDLQGKCLSIAAQTSMLKNQRRVRNYLVCQHYMLKKYIKRVQRFEGDVSRRVEELAKQPGAAAESAAADCDAGSGSLASSEASGSSAPSTSSPEESPSPGSQDGLIALLEADLVKLMRRCKHMLDVTDKYCVLNSETDLSIETEKFNEAVGQAPESPLPPWISKSPVRTSGEEAAFDSVDGISASDAEASDAANRDELEPRKLPATLRSRGTVLMTLESLANHLLVIWKTYTRKSSCRSLQT